MQQESEGGVIIPHLLGLNERLKDVNPNAAEFDKLVGLVHNRIGVLSRLPGTTLLTRIEGREILNIHQTFDNRRNVIVQTQFGVYVFSEDELMGRVYVPNLTPDPLTEEEAMAEALLAHTEASGTNGGSTVAATWTTAPLNQIIHQRNADGTAAAFVTALAANVFTLAAGIYRFQYKGMASHTAASEVKARLFNVTTGLPAWSGLENENSFATRADTNFNTPVFFDGWLDISGGGPVQFRIEHYSNGGGATVNFGRANSIAAMREFYRSIRILKTA